MELWVHHLCLLAGCDPALEAATAEETAVAATAAQERVPVLEDA
ncbi:MAG: hypothetical protein ABI414_15455 [Devosia sp.]